MENTPESRGQVSKLRQKGRKLFIVWIGRNFTKEDLVFAMDNRIYCTWENLRPEDKRLHETLQKLVIGFEQVGQFEQMVRSLKAVLLQSENEVPKLIMNEIKTAVGKLEKSGLQNEFVGPTAEPVGTGEVKLPFHKTQDFGDALSTVHDLERTGVLWIRGSQPLEEGKVEFIQGKIVYAQAGEVRGLKAIYRMFLWDEARFLFTRKDAREATVDEHINLGLRYICREGIALKKRYEKIRRELPPSELKLELEPASLHANCRLEKNEFSTLASIVELNQVSQVLNYNTLPDVILYESLISLRRNNMIRVVV
jgi:hypothetical protein